MTHSNEVYLFNQLLADNKVRFTRFAESYVHDLFIAEDIVMDSFLYYWENRANIKNDENIAAYILTVVKHKSLNYLEHLRIKENYSSKVREHAEWELNLRISTLKACDPEELFSKEISDIISKTVKNMPLKTKNIFVLRFSQNKSNKQIAKTLNLSEKTIEYHISKAYKYLRIALKDYYMLIIIVFTYININIYIFFLGLFSF